MQRFGVAILAATMWFGADAAHAQAARRGAVGALQALTDQLDKQAAADAEIEMARKKAEIELATRRKTLEMEAEHRRKQEALSAPPPRPDPPTRPDPDAEMNRLQPQWVKIVSSVAFESWLESIPKVSREMCTTTKEAVLLSECIDAFFNTRMSIRR